MKDPTAFAILCFAVAGAILIALPFIRAYRRALEHEQASQDARAFRDAEMRRVK